MICVTPRRHRADTAQKEETRMTSIIDRIEEEIAVLEESDPTGEVRERRIPMICAVDEKETEKRRAEAAAVLAKLKQ